MGESSAERRLLVVALAFGPLLLVLLLLLPLVTRPGMGLRHALMAGLLAAAAWCLPPPFGSGACALPLAATCAGLIAGALLSREGLAARWLSLLLALAVPTTALVTLNAGPNSLASASYIMGASTRAEYLSSRAADIELIDRLESLADEDLERKTSVLLVGELTDCQYTVPRERWSRELPRGKLLVRALRTAGITHVAVNSGSRPLREADFAGLVLLASFTESERIRLYAVPKEG